jgi:hypothetical protein
MRENNLTADERRSHAFGNLKVLLAEDNEVNQLLAKGILRFWGLEAKIAITGFEVVSLMQNEDFDLVLMDIQMPEKSGIEAAKEIRKLRDPHKKNVPIIALTANALKGEEQKYMAVGMDDFLTKPFKEGDLYEVIERVLRNDGAFGRNKLNQTKENKMAAETKVEEKLYDFDQLQEIAGGNRDFLASLAKIYLDTIPTNSAEMVAATQTGDWDKVSKLAHKLKSTVDSMNMSTITTAIRSLEIDAKNKVNTQGLKSLAVKVDGIIQTVAEQLKEEFAL